MPKKKFTGANISREAIRVLREKLREVGQDDVTDGYVSVKLPDKSSDEKIDWSKRDIIGLRNKEEYRAFLNEFEERYINPAIEDLKRKRENQE